MNDVSPGSFIGGTWTQIGGRTLVGAGTVTDENNLSQTFTLGAAKGELKHKLTVTELAKHRHVVESRNDGNPDGWSDKSSEANRQYWNTGDNSFSQQYNKIPSTADTGGDGYHNNLQPYLVVNMWKRVS